VFTISTRTIFGGGKPYVYLPSEDMGPRNMDGNAAAQYVHDGLQTAMRRHATAEKTELPATR
jgi:hypothetical protein